MSNQPQQGGEQSQQQQQAVETTRAPVAQSEAAAPRIERRASTPVPQKTTLLTDWASI